MTDAERKLWNSLRRNALGHRFRRQVPLGRHIVDFACFEERLVIEVDGGQHLEDPKDAARDRWLKEQGFRVLRFWNNEVLRNLAGVLEEIHRELDGAPESSPHPNPPPQGGRGEIGICPRKRM